MEKKLELMDWKAAEKTAEEAIRNNLLALELNEVVLIRAKKQIKFLGGKTSEDENAEAHKKFEKNKPGKE